MRVFMACSASDRVPTKYQELASTIADNLAERDHKLLIGGVATGMMGKCFLSFKFKDKRVKGIADLSDLDVMKNVEFDATDVANSTFERTKKLYESAQAVIVLPGGIGTYSEFFSILDEKRTRNDDKPVILVNYDGFFDDILHTIKYGNSLNFISDNDAQLFTVVTNHYELDDELDKLEGEI